MLLLLLILLNILIYVFYDCLSPNALSDLLSRPAQCVDFISNAIQLAISPSIPLMLLTNNNIYILIFVVSAIHCAHSIRNIFFSLFSPFFHYFSTEWNKIINCIADAFFCSSFTQSNFLGNYFSFALKLVVLNSDSVPVRERERESNGANKKRLFIISLLFISSSFWRNKTSS